ncbi:spermidine synthase [Legionella lansingensis]|uniref:Spermidine synthase n=1 Tax=Legionella lansingensis TaxID=45067 RepID=A0A0W0VGI3_9GAMM|nr:fused MFS/spermidine synthase [Legionella lansingensis]KTD19276.1 spermidine synthase [Legionella lansingensis]SNV50532.1 spermidine synthase [Legionella lansingensis]
MWKTFCGRCIYQSPCGAQVYQNFLFRWLKFNSSALQTLINRYYPHWPGLYYIKPLTVFVRIKPSTCCMLGLGGGGAAHALSPYKNNLKLTIVEHDIDVINIAKRFFMLDRLSHIEIIHQDANLFVEQSDRQFEHVLVDLFSGDSFPEHCNTECFFDNCKRILSPEGILAVNLANRNEQWELFQLIRKSFVNATLAVPVRKSANIIVFASKNESVANLVDKLNDHKKLKQVFWDSKWGCVGEVR